MRERRLDPPIDFDLVVEGCEALGERCHPCDDVGPVSLQHGTAFRRRAVAQRAEVGIDAHVGDRHAGCLEAIEEPDPDQGLLRVDPASAAIPQRCGNQPRLLVPAQRIDAAPGPARQLTDEHVGRISLVERSTPALERRAPSWSAGGCRPGADLARLADESRSVKRARDRDHRCGGCDPDLGCFGRCGMVGSFSWTDRYD